MPRQSATRPAREGGGSWAKPLKATDWPSASMQRQLMVDMADPVRRCAAALLDIDRMQLALDVVAPEFEEFAQLGKIGSQVEFLPDEALQQRGMVRQLIEDLGRGEPVALQLQLVKRHVRILIVTVRLHNEDDATLAPRQRKKRRFS